MGGLNAMDTYHDYFNMSVGFQQMGSYILTSIGHPLAAVPVSRLQSTISGPFQPSFSVALSMITSGEGLACSRVLLS